MRSLCHNLSAITQAPLSMTPKQMIARAAGVLRPHLVNGRLFGDVGAAVLSTSDNLYLGVSVDTTGWGLCAERSALAAMVTAGECTFTQVVAVWRDPQSRLYVLPPCGICREFMRALDPQNLQAEIILGFSESLPLRDLLPAHAWPRPLPVAGS